MRRRVRRDSGLPNRRDTPVTSAVGRRYRCRRTFPTKHYEALLEEPEEVEDIKVKNHVSREPVQGRKRISAASTENPRGKLAPAGHPTVTMAAHTEALRGGERRSKEGRNLSVTQENITSSSLESDSTFTSDEEESSGSTSSSLPSPEIFRREHPGETVTFPDNEDLLGLNRQIKNSTLLDESHAENIHLQRSPNLSTISDASAILDENKREINQSQGPEAVTKICADSSKTDKSSPWKTPQKLTNRKPIVCKKKVRFKSPMIVDTFEAKPILAAELSVHDASGPVRESSPVEQLKADEDAFTACEFSFGERMVRLRRPAENVSETNRFFDFMDDGDRDAFFQRMWQRWSKLRSAPLFPLTAAHSEDSVL